MMSGSRQKPMYKVIKEYLQPILQALALGLPVLPDVNMMLLIVARSIAE